MEFITENKRKEVRIMEENYYCPTCKNVLSKEEGCGSISYFCTKCKKLVSRSTILTKEQVEEQKNDE